MGLSLQNNVIQIKTKDNEVKQLGCVKNRLMKNQKHKIKGHYSLQFMYICVFYLCIFVIFVCDE
jgi:hypothetical protein